jgi:hypothetical protein
MRLDAEWTDDCQGKKDYDGEILSVSTRYWPAGGGFHVFDTREPEKGLHLNDYGSKPSAHCSLLLRDANDEDVTLIDKEFEGESFSAVSQQVEAWAQEQYEKAISVLRAAFVSSDQPTAERSADNQSAGK